MNRGSAATLVIAVLAAVGVAATGPAATGPVAIGLAAIDSASVGSASVGSAPSVSEIAGAQGMDRVFELRTYTVAEGRLPALLARFGGGETDLFEKHGMQGVGYWVPDEPPLSENTLVYMLAHDSREAAEASWQGFRDDPEWIEMWDASRADGPIVTNVESLFLNPTEFSPVR